MYRIERSHADLPDRRDDGDIRYGGRGAVSPIGMERMVDLDFLATIQIFRIFTRPELEAAEMLFKEVSFAKGEPIRGKFFSYDASNEFRSCEEPRFDFRHR